MDVGCWMFLNLQTSPCRSYGQGGTSRRSRSWQIGFFNPFFNRCATNLSLSLLFSRLFEKQVLYFMSLTWFFIRLKNLDGVERLLRSPWSRMVRWNTSYSQAGYRLRYRPSQVSERQQRCRKRLLKTFERIYERAIANAHSREISDRDLELYPRQAISKSARKSLMAGLLRGEEWL